MLTFCWHNIALSQLTLNADNNTTVPASATDGAASHCQHQGKAEVSLEAVSLVVTNQYDDDLGMDRSGVARAWVECGEWRMESQLCCQFGTSGHQHRSWHCWRSWQWCTGDQQHKCQHRVTHDTAMKILSMLTSAWGTPCSMGVISDKYFVIIANGLSRKQLRMLFVISFLWDKPW